MVYPICPQCDGRGHVWKPRPLSWFVRPYWSEPREWNELNYSLDHVLCDCCNGRGVMLAGNAVTVEPVEAHIGERAVPSAPLPPNEIIARGASPLGVDNA